MAAKQNDWSRMPFTEAVAFFRQKLPLPTRGWRDIERGDHDRAFVVAGLTRVSALEEIFTVIQRQLESGISFSDFQKQFDNIVNRAGWAYNGDRAWRARTIFETNIRTAYAAGRWAQLQDPDVAKALPYIQYKHSGAEHFRPLHKAWDGLVLLRTDKFWQTNLPPNGFGCKCQFFPLSARSLKRLGKSGPDRNPYDVIAENGGDTTRTVTDRSTGERVTLPAGVDLGWNYRPGESWLRGVTPLPKNAVTANRIIPNISWGDASVAARDFPASSVLSDDLSPEDLIAKFMQAFGGADSPVFFDDKIGNLLAINEQLFVDASGKTKIKKRGRDPYLLALAEAIQDPDEIFSLLEYREFEKAWRLKLRYIAEFLVPGKSQPLIAIFDWGKNGWEGKTAFVESADRAGYVSQQRQGVRLYRRTK
jgi:hypothetical protein